MMLFKRILAAVTVILVIVAIVLLKNKAKQVPVNNQQKEVKR